MALYAGVDLHSDNGFYGIIDDERRRVYQKRLPNNLEVVLDDLEPFKDEIGAIAVESTYNWYWLADGLMEHGYNVKLANPSAIDQYDGLKDVNDKTEAFFIALLLKLGILPEGYIYPKEERPVRDLLRRRLMFVKHRTANILSIQSLFTRQTGKKIGTNAIKKMKGDDLGTFLDDDCLVLAGETNLDLISFLTKKIKEIEKAVEARIELRQEYKKLLTVPGIGTILGLTIMLETGDIGRFPGVGNYTSYCRCVEAKRTTNSKKKGSNNSKNGNRYLAWAYVEAANFCIRWCEEAKAFFQRKAAQTNHVVAIKALSSKLSKACFFIIRDQMEFDISKIFK
jgi:transposase